MNTTCEYCEKKLQNLSMTKFQSIFSTTRSSADQDKKHFASTAYALEIAVINGSTCKKDNRTLNSLLHLEANSYSRTTSTAPIVTTSSTSTHKKQAVNQRKQSAKTKKNLQLQHSCRKKKIMKLFFSPQSYQLSATEKQLNGELF